MRYLIHILFISFIIVSFFSNSQNTIWEWGREANSSGEEKSNDVVANPLTGETFSCGYYTGDISGEFALGTNGTTDFSSSAGEAAYVAKYDANGVFQWAFNIDGPNAERATAIDIDAAGNIFVTGWFESSANFSGVSTSINISKTSTSSEDVFLAKYDPDGNLLWVVHGAANDEAISTDVSVNDDGVFITGWYFNTTLEIIDGLGSIDNTTLSGGDGRDAFVAAFNFDGTQRWLRKGSGVSNSDDLSYGITANESHVYVTGVISDDCTFIDLVNGNITVSPFVSGSNAIFMLSFSESNGAISWVDRIGSTGNDNCEAHGIFASEDKLYITGGVNDDNGTLSFPGVPNTNMATSSNQEIFLCQIDTSTRVTDWYNFEINDNVDDSRGEDIVVDNNGTIVITGYCAGTTAFDDDTIVASGNYDLFVSAYDDLGNGLWVESAKSSTIEKGTGVSFDNSPNYYVSGYYSNDMNIDPQPNLIHGGGDDICLLKIKTCAPLLIASCYSDSSVSADPSCNYIIGDYTDSITVFDDCGTATVSQSPAPFTVLPSGEHDITMSVEDGNGDTIVCIWTLTVEAPINPVVVSCGESYLGETTVGQGDNGSSFSCSANPTPGEDVYYQITVPSGNYSLGVSLENVVDTESEIKTFWVGSGCPIGSGCIQENTFDVGNQQFNSTNQNQLLFSAIGPGTYYFVVDSELDGVDQYDITFDCIASGVEFDETGCTPDTNNDGVYTTINGTPSLTLNPCLTEVDICNQIFVQNVNGGEWLDTVSMKLGPCYTNVTPSSPGPSGFYDGAGVWNAVYELSTNTIEWGFNYSGPQEWGDGIGQNYHCRTYTFCFEADITPGCNVSSDLDISIRIEDDAVNGVSSAASNGFDNAVVSLNVNDPSPTIACPVNQTVNSDPSLCSAVVSGLGPTSSFDNCPAPTITYALSGATTGSGSNDASGETFNLGVTTVTYTIVDNIGQTTSCSFTVEVVDNEAPTISCPSSVSVMNDANACTAVVNNIAPVSSGDDCLVASITYTLTGATTGSGSNDASGEAFNIGVTTVTYTITDGSGNTSNCSLTVTVNENQAPTISCPGNQNENRNALCQFVLPDYTSLATGLSDNCTAPGSIVVTQLPAIGSTISANTTITLTADDGNGNTASCTFDVLLSDNTAPTISCPSNLSVNNDPGACTALVNGIAPTGSGDNCSVASISYVLTGATTGSGSSDASGETFNEGVTTVTYSITDASSNTTSCSFTVTVVDNEAPTISCPSAVSVNNDAGVCTAVVNSIAPISSGDNCSVASISYALTGATTGSGSNDASGETFNVGTTTVAYTVTDGAGNTSNCSFTVTVVDNEAPTISCPSAVSVNNDAGVCTAVVNSIAPISSGDNCSVASITYALTGATTVSGSNDASGETFNEGVTTVTYTIIDGAGNSTSCSFNVEVVDNEVPIISCPSDVSVNNDAGVCTAVVNSITPISSGDNCSVASISYALTGATTSSGSNDASGETFNVGVTTVTYTITDGASNLSSCSFTVTVVDNDAPTISCPSAVSVNNDAGNCTAVVNSIAPISSGDNCSVASISYALTGATTGSGSNDASGETFNLGVTTVTYTVADAAGNTSNCSFNVTVVDNEAPTISCPSAVSVNNDAGDCAAVVNSIAPISSGDNCSVASITYVLTGATIGSGSNDASGETFNLGVTTVTYTVTDAQGLVDSCSFNVSVLDSEAPIISVCPSNITQCETIASWTTPTATDNCGVASITQTQGPSSGSTFPVGTTNISYDIIDNSGNIENCAFTVTILPPIDSDFWIPDTLCLATALPVDLDDSTNLNLSIPETDVFYSDSSQVVINGDNLLFPQSTGEGNYPITHVVDNGYCTDTTEYVITMLPAYQSAFAALDTICASADTFDLSSLFIGTTTEGGQFFSPSGANIIQDSLWLLNGGSGTYDIGYSVGVGFCADTTYRQIYLSPDVDPSWQLTLDSICESNPLIDLQPFVTGTYNSTSLFSAQGITGNIFDPSGLLGEQVITYLVGEGQCRESLTDTLFIIDNPSIDAGPDLEVCGDTVELFGTSDSNITWWSSSNDIAIIDSTLLNGATANLLGNEGDYTIYLNSDNGYCFGIDSLNIGFFMPPTIVDAGPDQVLDYTFNTFFDALVPDYGFGTWESQNNSVVIDPNNPISEVNTLQIGENVFYWVVQNGVCPLDSSEVVISVRDIIIPEGFSPNGDNINDFLTIPGIQNASSSEVIIFNRWGDKIYQSVDYKNDWNGENQSGDPLPDDTYYYIILIDERKFSDYIIIRR